MPDGLMLIFAFGPALLLEGLVERLWPTQYLQSEFDGKGKYVALAGWLGAAFFYWAVPEWRLGISIVSMLCLLFVVGFVLYSLVRVMLDDERNTDPYP